VKVNSLIFGEVLFKLNKSCKPVTSPLRLVCLSGTILLREEEQDMVFEESHQEGSEKKKHTDQMTSERDIR